MKGQQQILATDNFGFCAVGFNYIKRMMLAFCFSQDALYQILVWSAPRLWLFCRQPPGRSERQRGTPAVPSRGLVAQEAAPCPIYYGHHDRSRPMHPKLLASCFLLLASCFLLLASCFLLLASCFLLLAIPTFLFGMIGGSLPDFAGL
jgi:hypothetical protein